MLSWLVRVGSRGYVVSILLTSIVVGMEQCGREQMCVDGEGCGEGGGGSGVYCGPEGEETECPADACRTGLRCSENGLECTGDWIDGWEDNNACTVDNCDSETGEITHREYTPEELDDGDPCTGDYCWTTEGIVHQDICGGT